MEKLSRPPKLDQKSNDWVVGSFVKKAVKGRAFQLTFGSRVLLIVFFEIRDVFNGFTSGEKKLV